MHIERLHTPNALETKLNSKNRIVFIAHINSTIDNDTDKGFLYFRRNYKLDDNIIDLVYNLPPNVSFKSKQIRIKKHNKIFNDYCSNHLCIHLYS